MEMDVAGLKALCDRISEYISRLKSLSEMDMDPKSGERLKSIIHRGYRFQEALTEVSKLCENTEMMIIDRIESGKRSYRTPGVGKIEATFAGEDIRKCM